MSLSDGRYIYENTDWHFRYASNLVLTLCLCRKIWMHANIHQSRQGFAYSIDQAILTRHATLLPKTFCTEPKVDRFRVEAKRALSVTSVQGTWKEQQEMALEMQPWKHELTNLCECIQALGDFCCHGHRDKRKENAKLTIWCCEEIERMYVERGGSCD